MSCCSGSMSERLTLSPGALAGLWKKINIWHRATKFHLLLLESFLLSYNECVKFSTTTKLSCYWVFNWGCANLPCFILRHYLTSKTSTKEERNCPSVPMRQLAKRSDRNMSRASSTRCDRWLKICRHPQETRLWGCNTTAMLSVQGNPACVL